MKTTLELHFKNINWRSYIMLSTLCIIYCDMFFFFKILIYILDVHMMPVYLMSGLSPIWGESLLQAAKAALQDVRQTAQPEAPPHCAGDTLQFNYNSWCYIILSQWLFNIIQIICQYV